MGKVLDSEGNLQAFNSLEVLLFLCLFDFRVNHETGVCIFRLSRPGTRYVHVYCIGVAVQPFYFPVMHTD